MTSFCPTMIRCSSCCMTWRCWANSCRISGSDLAMRSGGQPAGVAPIATLALLNSGETAKNPKVAKALDYLNASELPRATYAAALQIIVFCQADAAHYKVKINEPALWLEATQIKEGKNK